MQPCPYCMEQSRSGRYLFTTPLWKALRLSVTTNCYPQPSRVAGLHIFVYHQLFFILRCMGQYKRTHYLLPELPCMSMGQMPSVACDTSCDFLQALISHTILFLKLLQTPLPPPFIRCTESPYHLPGVGQIEPEPKKTSLPPSNIAIAPNKQSFSESSPCMKSGYQRHLFKSLLNSVIKSSLYGIVLIFNSLLNTSLTRL